MHLSTLRVFAVALLFHAACSSDNAPKPSGADGGRDAATTDGGAAVGNGGGGTGGGGTGGRTNTGDGGSSDGGAAITPMLSDGGVVPNLECKRFAEQCASAADCCSGICDAASLTCAASTAQCAVAGEACAVPTDCCNLSCKSEKCGATACVSDGEACSSNAECCGGACNGGKCAALNATCKTGGNACSSDGECCSTLCSNGQCQLGASYCIQTGDVCARASDCCSAACVKAAGATLGTCDEPPSGASNCSGSIDGTVCSACGTCCSRLCAPYAATGVYICQPASGCHVNGDLCRENRDCCGGEGSGVPGDGNVTCEKADGADVGICRNPMSCNPQGNVCHFKNYACSISSSRNNCCAGVGNSGVCQLDKLGVPRCNGLGDTCRNSGESCASSDDCCNDLPCVPDEAGALHCYTPPKDGPGCVAGGGGCTITGDCCVGSTCVMEIGSTQGTCSVPPPPTAGTGGGSGSGGSGSGGAGGAGGSTACAQYGQSCGASGDCCSGIPCTSGSCVFPVN